MCKPEWLPYISICENVSDVLRIYYRRFIIPTYFSGLKQILYKCLAVFQADRNFRMDKFYDVTLFYQWSGLEMSDVLWNQLALGYQ